MNPTMGDSDREASRTQPGGDSPTRLPGRHKADVPGDGDCPFLNPVVCSRVQCPINSDDASAKGPRPQTRPHAGTPAVSSLPRQCGVVKRVDRIALLLSSPRCIASEAE